MEKELGVDVIKATQASLGKYVKRPPLTEKLLRKPPFRFLHDIVSSVHRTTGFFEGLFEENELVSENVKDRESKILFLNKVISVVGTTTGKSLTVKSSKIVAGQEADKTNELLQYLALALDKELSSHEAVQKYKESTTAKDTTEAKSQEKDSTNKLVKKNTDSKNLTSRSNEKLTTNKKESGAVNKIVSTHNEPKIKNKESSVTKTETHSKKSITKNKNTVSDKKRNDPDLKGNQKVSKKTNDEKPKEEGNKNKDNEPVRDLLSKQVLEEEAKTKDSIFNVSDGDGKAHHDENDLNSSHDQLDIENYGKSTNDTKSIPDQIYPDKVIIKEGDAKPVKEIISSPVKSVEPVLTRNESTDTDDKSSEYKKIDKVINNFSRQNSEVIRPPSVRPPSSRPGAPRLREKIDNVIPDTENILLAKVNIITENANNEEDEDTSVIFVEQQSHGDQSSQNQQDQIQLSSNEHGHLVQQILDSQKEFSQLGKTEIEWQFGAHKLKEAVNQEIEELRFNIQALSRGANPLGKLLDHIQEDAEVMRQELQQWTNVYDEVSKEMQKQKIAKEETLFPLQSRLKQLDADIQEKHDKINDFRILIHKNVSRIEKLLLNGNVQ